MWLLGDRAGGGGRDRHRLRRATRPLPAAQASRDRRASARMSSRPLPDRDHPQRARPLRASALPRRAGRPTTPNDAPSGTGRDGRAAAGSGLDRPVDVAVSTSAPHWLRAVHAELATVLKPGGVPFNGDHFCPDEAPSPRPAKPAGALLKADDKRLPGGRQKAGAVGSMRSPQNRRSRN